MVVSETVRYHLSSSVVIPVLILDDTIPKESRQVPVPFIENQLQECLSNIAYDSHRISRNRSSVAKISGSKFGPISSASFKDGA